MITSDIICLVVFHADSSEGLRSIPQAHPGESDLFAIFRVLSNGDTMFWRAFWCHEVIPLDGLGRFVLAGLVH